MISARRGSWATRRTQHASLPAFIERPNAFSRTRRTQLPSTSGRWASCVITEMVSLCPLFDSTDSTDQLHHHALDEVVASLEAAVSAAQTAETVASETEMLDE